VLSTLFMWEKLFVKNIDNGLIN